MPERHSSMICREGWHGSDQRKATPKPTQALLQAYKALAGRSAGQGTRKGSRFEAWLDTCHVPGSLCQGHTTRKQHDSKNSFTSPGLEEWHLEGLHDWDFFLE